MKVDCIVIGAGVIGLAVARAVARGGREVIVIERERHAGLHASSRNSEVVHAGIHYAPGSLKARLCVEGREMLERYCEVHGIGYRRCGKLTVVSSAAQERELAALAANARACGVELRMLDGAEAQRLEPELQCALALESPCSGIVDSHGLLQCLQGDVESYGANVAFGTQVTALLPVKAGTGNEGIEVCVDFEARASVHARWVVNCAGLSAAAVAASIADFPAAAIPVIHFAKGSYFSLPGRAPFSRLIYPLPAPSGHLGVHLTLDLDGAARFGPDMEWVTVAQHGKLGGNCTPNYAVDARRVQDFIDAIREYWPALPAQRLVPAYAGIRPKLSGPGEPARDFLISGPLAHGVAGVVNLFGIDSPGLTACLALGDRIAALIDA
jgi:L-2-hydroxyglutarate oxidase LhgO